MNQHKGNGGNMSEKYELVTIADILAIPSDRFESFLEGLPNYLRTAKAIYDLAVVASELQQTDVPVEFNRMVWIDDEKHENTINLHGMDDGEVKSITTLKVDN